MEPAAAKFLMALIILTRSSAFLFSKFVLEELAPFQALGFRFTLAFLVMGLLLRRHLLCAWKKDAYLGPKSLGLGLLLFAVMGAEMRSLLTAEIHTVAFLENLSLALVPLFLALWYRRLPSARILQGVGFILLGVAALTIGTVGFTLAGGEGWALLAAVFYAGYIIAMGKLSHSSDPLSLGTLHMGFMGLLSFGAALILEGGIPLPQASLTWQSLAFQVLVCSCFGFAFQPKAQQYLTAEEAGLYCAINPLFASCLGHWFLDETLGAAGILGAAYILTGLGFVNWKGLSQERQTYQRSAVNDQRPLTIDH